MSRIDEALARLRNAEPIEPPAVLVSEGPEPQFATEVPPSAAVVPEVEAVSAAAPAHAGPSLLDAPESGALSEPTAEFRPIKDIEKLALSSTNAASTEQYRRLAARLHLAQSEFGIRVVMVTSAMPGEGKTLTATNLALTLAESYKRQVLLLDADLRRPSIHTLLQIPNVGGLNDGLQEDAPGPIPLLRLTERLTVLTAGRPDHNPMSMLSSSRMKRVLSEARASFDWVIIDTPPVALLTDAHLLAALVDTVLLVIHAGSTRLAAINTAVECVGRERIFGVVLNRADESRGDDHYQQYYYAHSSKEGAA
jgi:capsular exopolysaccharide synthesis family protein